MCTPTGYYITMTAGPSRLAMKLCLVISMLWISVMIPCAYGNMNNDGGCNASELDIWESSFTYEDNTSNWHCPGVSRLKLVSTEEPSSCCVLFPTGMLNCRLTFHPCPGIPFSVSAAICIGEKRIASWDCLSQEVLHDKEAGVQHILCHNRVDRLDKDLSVFLHINESFPEGLKIRTTNYDFRDIEVLNPPPNISALFSEGGLLVKWEFPKSLVPVNPSCFQYKIEMQVVQKQREETFYKEVDHSLQFLDHSADPTLTYKVRMRARISETCRGSQHWSDWSQIITVSPTEPSRPSGLVIASIALGIPMALLALVLIRPQRAFKLLFPPIPRPPLKYKHFLEKKDGFYGAPVGQTTLYVEEFMEIKEDEEPHKKSEASNSSQP